MADLVWRAQEWHPFGTGGLHLSDSDAERALCGASVRHADPELRPDQAACCGRCETLAVIAGRAVPATFRKRNDDAGQGELL